VKYRTIVADPPWPIGDMPAWFCKDRRSHREQSLGTNPRPYEVMTLPQIEALPIRNLADSCCDLYLWTINQYVPDAYTIARAWGFRPSSLLAWCKPPMGLGVGGLFPSNIEFILYCRRVLSSERDYARHLIVTQWLNARVKESGVKHADILRHFGFNSGSGQVTHWTALTPGGQPSIPTLPQWETLKLLLNLPDDMDGEIREMNGVKGGCGASHPIPSERRKLTNGRWFTWPRGSHSAKPEAFLDLVEQVSPGPYLELFARRQRLGWDTWGNECRCDVEMDAS